MLVRWPVAALLVVVLGIAGCGGSDSRSTQATKAGGTQGIGGQWTGTLTQDSGGDGTGTYVFTETIKSGAGGKCKGIGTVHLERVSATRLRYRFEGGGVTSRGILRPARMSEWTSIFEEAGVQVN